MTHGITMRIWSAAAGVLVTASCFAQQPSVYEKPLDGIEAGLQAYEAAEAQRRYDFDQQLGMVESQRRRLEFWNQYGAPPEAYWSGGPVYDWSPYAGFGRPLITPPYYKPVDQPIGREEVQTGPNRWESRPIYAPRPEVKVRPPLLPVERERVPREEVREAPALPPAFEELPPPEKVEPAEPPAIPPAGREF